jgi:hypothetical protein
MTEEIFQRLPGLLRETILTTAETDPVPDDIYGGLKRLPMPAGSKVHIRCEGLKPGDKLHDGKLHGCITNEQHWGLIEASGIKDTFSHWQLISALGDITDHYSTFTEFEREHGPFGPHRDRLAKIANLAKQLGRLLEAEPLDYELVRPMVANLDVRIRSDVAGGIIEKVKATLPAIQKRATQLVENPDELRGARLEDSLGHGKGPVTGKSAERRFIWEPTFQLWVKLGRKVGYSADGPIMRFIRVVHEALEIPEPKGGAVQQAVDDFLKRPRSPKKKKAKGRALRPGK